MKFRIKTKDSILFTNRVFVLEASSKEAVIEQIKKDYPNSHILAISEEESNEHS